MQFLNHALRVWIPSKCWFAKTNWDHSKEYSESCQTSVKEPFGKIINDWKPLNIFAKRSILDVSQNAPMTYASGIDCSWIINCVKKVRIRSFPGPYFPAFGLNTERYSVWLRENMDQKNSKYGHLSRSDIFFKRFSDPKK